MPNIYFITFEIVIYIQLALCLRHAMKHGAANLLRLGFGILYGVSLELATIRQLDAYEYGRFMIMVADVPLCIGVAWSCIIYAAMEFSNASSLSYWLRPVLDGLLALNIDLALDAVAIRLGFWDWGAGLNFQYFGVPYANFWAWFWVVFSFSMGYRILSQNSNWTGKWLSAPLAFIIGLLGVIGTNAFIVFVIPGGIRIQVIFVTLGAALLIIFARHPLFHQKPVTSAVFWIPFITHAYVLVAGIASGAILQPVFLLFAGVVMMVASLYLHRKTTKEIFSARA